MTLAGASTSKQLLLEHAWRKCGIAERTPGALSRIWEHQVTSSVTGTVDLTAKQRAII